MSTTVDEAIINALCEHLDQIPLAPTRTIAYPLVPFTPPPKQPHLQAWPLLRADPSHAPLDPEGTSERRGLFQVDVVWPTSQGEKEAVALAGEVVRHFANGTRLYHAGFQVRVSKPPSIRPTISDDPWIRVPVRIPYLVFAKSPS